MSMDPFGDGYADYMFSTGRGDEFMNGKKQGGGGGGSDGCYIATCVYGSYDCPEVWTLRRYRDDVLKTTAPGRLFIRAYYAISPTLVRIFGAHGWFNSICRPPLDRKVRRLTAKGISSSPYHDKGRGGERVK